MLSKNREAALISELFSSTISFKFRGSYIDSTNHQSNSVTEVRLGANAGVGGELVFTDNFYFTIKARYHSLFGIGGLISYIDGFGGFTVRL